MCTKRTVPLIIIDLAYPQPFRHRASVKDQHSHGKPKRSKRSWLRR